MSDDRLPADPLIGSDAVTFAAQAEAKRAAEAKRWQEFSMSGDAKHAAELPDMKF